MMQTTRWNRRRLAIFAIGLLITYWILSASRNTFKSEVIIRDTKPEIVWEFVADFKKMQLLNPTILDFRIVKDDGNFNHWKYSVIYTERLSHWPYWLNVADADYVVKKIFQNGHDEYLVISKHRTCFVAGFYCLYSTGTFLFYKQGEHTYCSESVDYECPPLFGPFCRREVEFQRKAITQNLANHFDNMKHRK